MNETKGTLLRTEGLTVRYGKTTALDGVTLSVPEGSITALLGRNGAGKSSFIRCVLGMQKASAGTAWLLGRDSWKDRSTVMEHTGYVPEEPDAPPEMTPLAIARFLGTLYSNWDSDGVQQRLRDYEIPMKSRFGSLSKGQKGLTMLALALGNRPRLLILDDPTLGLDVVARKLFFEEVLVHVADTGTSVLITTHDLGGTDKVADQIAVLKQGNLVLSEKLESLKGRFRRLTYGIERPEDPEMAGRELEGFEALKVKVRGWGVEAIVSNFTDERLHQMSVQEHVRDLEVHGLGLEEIFLALSGEEKGGRK